MIYRNPLVRVGSVLRVVIRAPTVRPNLGGAEQLPPGPQDDPERFVV